MFVEFDTLDGDHVSLRQDIIWAVTVVSKIAMPSEVLLQGLQSIKVSESTANQLQEFLRSH